MSNQLVLTQPQGNKERSRKVFRRWIFRPVSFKQTMNTFLGQRITPERVVLALIILACTVVSVGMLLATVFLFGV